MTERQFAIDVVRRLVEAGHRALWAGGCVRDELLDIAPKDYDVASDATPTEVQQLFRRTVAVGESFGVVEVLGPRDEAGQFLKVQVATFRSDGDYMDGRRPETVTFSSPEEDARRRDFTINGMFYDPLADEVLDFVGGQADLRVRILRAIGDPEERFREDKLRLLRAVRFATRFGLAVEPATADAVRRMADQLPVVSAERIADELRKMLVDPHRGDAIRLLGDLRLFTVVFPELREPPGVVLDHLPAEAGFPLALTALLRGMTRKAVAGVCRRLKLANDERERAEWLTEHRSALRGEVPTSVAKVLLANAGADDLLALHQADSPTESVAEWAERRAEWTRRGTLDPPVLVTGEDLKARGLQPGPLFKRLLDAVRRAQLDETIGTSAEALAMVDRMVSEADRVV